MNVRKIYLSLCLLITPMISAEITKAPRPGVNPFANNAIVAEQTVDLNPVLNLLRRILFILENTDNEVDEILPLMQQMLTELSFQENLMEQTYAETLLSNGLLQSIISLLEQQPCTENTESLIQLLTAILSIVIQTQQTTSNVADEQQRSASQQEQCCSVQLAQSSLLTAQLQDLISQSAACPCSTETNNLLNILLGLVIAQQAEIDALKNDTQANFTTLETNVQNLAAQNTLQESQLQDIITTLATIQTDVIATLTTLQAHV